MTDADIHQNDELGNNTTEGLSYIYIWIHLFSLYLVCFCTSMLLITISDVDDLTSETEEEILEVSANDIADEEVNMKGIELSLSHFDYDFTLHYIIGSIQNCIQLNSCNSKPQGTKTFVRIT